MRYYLLLHHSLYLSSTPPPPSPLARTFTVGILCRIRFLFNVSLFKLVLFFNLIQKLSQLNSHNSDKFEANESDKCIVYFPSTNKMISMPVHIVENNELISTGVKRQEDERVRSHFIQRWNEKISSKLHFIPIFFQTNFCSWINIFIHKYWACYLNESVFKSLDFQSFFFK